MVKSLKALSVLVLVVLLSAVSARFTEEFKPNKDGNAKAITPGLWKQIGDIMQGGRGTDETRYAMRLNPEKPRTAETAVLRWDGTTDRTMDFWYYLETSTDCPTGPLKLSFSCDGNYWKQFWALKAEEMLPNSYEVVHVPLPVSASCGAFAVRWDYVVPPAVKPGVIQYNPCFGGNYLWLDDITFPARPL